MTLGPVLMHCRRLAVLAALGLVFGCGQEAPPEQRTSEPQRNAKPASGEEAGATETAQPGFLNRYQALGNDATDNLRRDVRALCASIASLLSTPDDPSLQKARNSWRYAHDAYLAWQTLHYLPDSQSRRARQAMLVDAWPVMAGYIDRTADHPASGIVYDTTVELTLDTLLEQHQLTDPSEVSVGFHAMEFLLWGEPDASARSAADFNPAAAEEQSVKGIERRRVYLDTLCGGLKTALIQANGATTPRLSKPAKVIEGLGDVLETLILEQRIVSLLKARLPDPECAFSGEAICGMRPMTKSLRAVFLGPEENIHPESIVGTRAGRDTSATAELETTARNALSALENLAHTTQRDDLFAAEALSRKWLAEIRGLQRALSKPGEPVGNP